MKTSKHIADRIRLLIATRQFQVGEVLPSTRKLGMQLESSFHTVRKAYQLLAEEGLLKSEPGRGFVVNSPKTLLDKSERLEKGAEKFRELLEELIGYGLDEEEVETLFQEQLNFMDWPERISSCATVGPTYEIAQMLSSTIRAEVGVKSNTMLPGDFEKSVNYDALFVPLPYYNNFVSEAGETKLIPIFYSLGYEMLLSVVERATIGKVGLIAVEKRSLDILERELRQALATDIDIETGIVDGRSLPSMVHQVDLVFYTDSCARVAENQLTERRRRKLTYELSSKSVEIVRSELWDDF
ncbi:MAG: GntR family transcriptional regulator [Balneolia bacterium]|nr:GntR family transcriptional regulator [Balneolia bacterium]